MHTADYLNCRSKGRNIQLGNANLELVLSEYNAVLLEEQPEYLYPN